MTFSKPFYFDNFGLHKLVWSTVHTAFCITLILLSLAGQKLTCEEIPPIVLSRKTFTIYNAHVSFKNSRMSSFRDLADDELAFKAIGIISGDRIVLKAGVIPESLPFADTDFFWHGEQESFGQTAEFTLVRVGPFVQKLKIDGRPALTIPFQSVGVDGLSENMWCVLHPVSCSQVFLTSQDAGDWVAVNHNELGQDTHNGRADAARHAYWNVRMVAEGLSSDAIIGATMAHEVMNIHDQDEPSNEAAMDMLNNAAGLQIGLGLGVGTSVEQSAAAVISALEIGRLIILDNIDNTAGSSLIMPSNK